MELAEIVMNPVRQRIFQYLLLHETGTVKEIRKALPDVPGASLYRHIKLLTESGILTVVGENRIRGTVESIYSLNKSALEIDDDGTVVQTALKYMDIGVKEGSRQRQITLISSPTDGPGSR